MTETVRAHRHVVFYDGVCGLCNRTVRFLLAVDREQRLEFASLQGKSAEGLRRKHNLAEDLETLIFVENYGAAKERVSYRSTGVLRILGRVGGFWRVISWLRFVPAPVRDFVYRVIARYRYRWFGKYETCPLPSAETAERFLD